MTTLSSPIYRLKREARALARDEDMPLHAALDRIAQREGFARWSLLVSQGVTATPARRLAEELTPGQLALIGARPGQGKTLLSVQLLVEAMRAGREGVFFSLDFTAADMRRCFDAIDEDPEAYAESFRFDDSDDISAGYIIEQLSAAGEGTVVVVDYLQALDARRANPPLAEQVQALREFARNSGVICVFVAQIDRRFDAAGGQPPGPEDLRLPNPLDLSLFDCCCFLNEDEVRIAAVA